MSAGIHATIPCRNRAADLEDPTMTDEAPSAPHAPPKPEETPKPVVHVYSRQKDQHVVGPGCWCFPKVEIVDGRPIIVHKRS